MELVHDLLSQSVLGIAGGIGTLGREDIIKATKKTQFNSEASTEHLLSRDKELVLRWEENRKMHNLVTSLKELLALLNRGGGGGKGRGSKHTKGRKATAY